jgi:hypothetical protein
MKTPPIIKKTWIKPAVKAVSVKKDTYNGTNPSTKENDLVREFRYLPNP